MTGITPFVWFADDADNAARFYVSIFKKFRKNSKYIRLNKLDGAPGPKGKTYIVELVLDGMHFSFINGGKQPGYTLSSGAISFVINCKNQKEIDHFWNSLVKGGKPVQCGWLKDRYGMTWQVVPEIFPKLLNGADKEGSARAMSAMLKMVKFDIKKLKDAYAGKD